MAGTFGTRTRAASRWTLRSGSTTVVIVAAIGLVLADLATRGRVLAPVSAAVW